MYLQHCPRAAQRVTSEAGARAAGGAPGGADVGGGRLRLGLRIEQRGSVRKHVAALQQRLERAAADMQAWPACLGAGYSPSQVSKQ